MLRLLRPRSPRSDVALCAYNQTYTRLLEKRQQLAELRQAIRELRQDLKRHAHAAGIPYVFASRKRASP